MFCLDEDMNPIPSCVILSMSHVSRSSKNMRYILVCVGTANLTEQGRLGAGAPPWQMSTVASAVVKQEGQLTSGSFRISRQVRFQE